MIEFETFTCTSISCLPAACIKREKRDKSTPLGNMVASAIRIAIDMHPNITANDFTSCFFNMHLQRNSDKPTFWATHIYIYITD